MPPPGARHCQRVNPKRLKKPKGTEKYPNSFIIVYRSAMLHQALGLYKRDNAKLRRALELLEKPVRFCTRIPPRISEQTLYVAMAEISQDFEDDERALELFQQHNTDGLYSDRIGRSGQGCLARPGGPAVPVRIPAHPRGRAGAHRDGLPESIPEQPRLCPGTGIGRWALPIFTAMPRPECTSFMDKINSVFYLFQAHVLLKTGQPEEARTSAEEAHRLAVRFDAAPSYAADTIRFAMPGEDSTVNDDLGRPPPRPPRTR